MSTIFGVRNPEYNPEDEDSGEEEFFEVAFRSSYWIWRNPLAQLLPDDMPVYPLDETTQGIKTIGDIKKDMLCK